jgi:Asp-tRNA(Asn)/Glu-tRNA(Gln) amidotransferase A subunit family amidase
MSAPLPPAPLPADLVGRRIPYTTHTNLLRPYVPLTGKFLNGTDSPRAYLERSLAAIAEHEPSVRAFVLHDAGRARAAADAATQRWHAGAPLSPIDGIPLAVKDIIETIDFPTQMNSPIYTGWHSNRDAASVAALRQAGAVLLGKTVTTEFACSNCGPTRNPFDSTCTPGGSSSGSAAATGSGMVALALGTQTQASTIRPAGYCGAYALKATHDALHVGGVTPLAPTQDHLGVFAASLDDLWAGAMAIARRAGGTPPHPALVGPATMPDPVRPAALVRLDMRGWSETNSASQAVFETAIATVAAAGVRIIDRHNDPAVAALEADLLDANDYSYDLLAWETRWPLGAYFAHGPDMVGKRIHELLAHAATMDEAAYDRARARREALRQRVENFATGADGFLALCSSGPAIVSHEYTGSRSYALPWTMVGAPAFALPLLEVDALPLGLQLCGFRDRDAAGFATAAWLCDVLLPR